MLVLSRESLDVLLLLRDLLGCLGVQVLQVLVLFQEVFYLAVDVLFPEGSHDPIGIDYLVIESLDFRLEQIVDTLQTLVFQVLTLYLPAGLFQVTGEVVVTLEVLQVLHKSFAVLVPALVIDLFVQEVLQRDQHVVLDGQF